MSQPYRTPVGMQPNLGNRMMMPPMGIAGAPTGVPVLPNAYGLVATQQHQYVVHPSFQQNMPNMTTNIRMPVINPGPIQGMYMPVNRHMRAPNVDPSKLLEEQKRMEKERNFQLQQLRLKQFTVAGKKGSLNAENLIDNMFGKVQQKPSRSSTDSPVANFEPTEKVKPFLPVFETNPAPQVNITKQEVQSNAPLKQPKKELDAMMQECSKLSGSQKANTFSKPTVKESTRTVSKSYTFTASNKSRDWKNLQGLDEVFVAPKARFPEWCTPEKIPEVYRQIEMYVTSNGSHPPDTKLVFPILVSSGLPQQTLGQIWELVNQSAPGNLTIEEMYSALALIAVTQAGHPVKSADILHQLPACPIPQLQCFSSPSQSRSENENPTSVQPVQTLIENADKPAPVPTVPMETGTHQVLRPSAISLVSNKQTIAMQNLLTKQEGGAAAGSGFISSPDDEFDDFKSATPTAINFSMGTPTSNWVDSNDDFDDFKQAPPINSSTTPNINLVSEATASVSVGVKFPPTSVNIASSASGITMPPSSLKTALPPSLHNNANPDKITKPVAPFQDLMSSDEDKYSAFRSLQQTEPEESSQWCEFTNAMPDFNQQHESGQSSQINKTNPNPAVQFTEGGDFFALNPSVKVTEDDDFGDFLCAEVPQVTSVTSQFESLSTHFEITPPTTGPSTNFADFSNFKDTSDDFSDFACSFPTKTEVGHDFLLHHAKDNISLAESQSVSSLELGTFDGGGQSGESKSSLSRQGSIPSLDLKPVFVESNDNDDFGEFQSIGVANALSKSPSPASDVKVNEANISLAPAPVLTFHTTPNLPLVDKYQVMRAEQKKDEDQYISCWTRCLQNSVNILQNTKKIFNQMSCSSVCNEVLKSEEGENYIKDVIEVYKIVRRISVASKSVGKQTGQMLDLLNESEHAWNTVCGFFQGTLLMPDDSSLEFSNAVLSSNCEDNTRACGLCLLNIDFKTKSKGKDESLQLSYGGRNYHSTCANLWVNCVDPLLPALILPQLL